MKFNIPKDDIQDALQVVLHDRQKVWDQLSPERMRHLEESSRALAQDSPQKGRGH